MKGRKVINGRHYMHYLGSMTKTEAKAEAKELRKDYLYVRVLPTPNTKGKWSVYLGGGRRKSGRW